MQKRKKMKNRRIYEWKVREKEFDKILHNNFKHDKLKKQKFKQLLTRNQHKNRERERAKQENFSSVDFSISS